MADDERVDVTFQFTLKSEYFPSGTPGDVVVFLPRSYAATTHHYAVIRTSIQTDVPCSTITVSFPRRLPSNTPVMVWWVPIRYMKGSEHAEATDTEALRWTTGLSPGMKPQPYKSRAGVGAASIEAIGMGTSIVLYDTESCQVATVRATVLAVQHESVELLSSQPLVSGELKTGVVALSAANAIDRSFYARSNNISYLSNCSFSTVRLPVGCVPLWSYPWGATHGRQMDHTTDEQLLLAHAQAAFYSMTIEPGDEVEENTVIEFIAEMQTVITRHTLYVPDSTKRSQRDEPTDDWDYPRDDGTGADDCEGLSALVLRECHILRHGRFKSPLLRLLQLMEQRYIAMFCIVAISTGAGRYTYHAMVLKVDAAWLRWKLKLSPSSSSTPPETNSNLLPVVLLESTTYTVSCPAYNTARCTPSTYRRSHIITPIESNPKAPFAMVAPVYKHVLIGIAPDLMDECKLSRIDFTINGRSGVPFDALFAYSPGIDFVGTYASEEEIEQTSVAFECMPRLMTMRPPLGEAVRVIRKADEIIVKGRLPVVDMSFRFVDWDTGMERLIMEQTKTRTIEVVQLALSAKLNGIRVRGWD